MGQKWGPPTRPGLSKPSIVGPGFFLGQELQGLERCGNAIANPNSTRIKQLHQFAEKHVSSGSSLTNYDKTWQKLKHLSASHSFVIGWSSKSNLFDKAMSCAHHTRASRSLLRPTVVGGGWRRDREATSAAPGGNLLGWTNWEISSTLAE